MVFQFMGKAYRKSGFECNRQSDIPFHHNCDMNTFGERLKFRRNKLRMTQTQLAHKAKISQTTISDIERGRNSGSTELLSIAKALQCRPEWLEKGELPEDAHGEDSPPPSSEKQAKLEALRQIGEGMTMEELEAAIELLKAKQLNPNASDQENNTVLIDGKPVTEEEKRMVILHREASPKMRQTVPILYQVEKQSGPLSENLG